MVAHEEMLKRLKQQHPELLRGPLNDGGIACGCGWEGIIDTLLYQIEETATLLNQPWPVVTQIKEKFGSLRVYFKPVRGFDLSPFTQLIDNAYNKSDTTCEDCGAVGHTQNCGGWIKTVCGEGKCLETPGESLVDDLECDAQSQIALVSLNPNSSR